MIATVEAIKAVIRHHDLRWLIVTDMDGGKQDQCQGTQIDCVKTLERAAELLPGQPFRVEAGKTEPSAAGGKRAKMADHFVWTVRPERAGPVVMSNDSRVLEAIQGLSERLRAIEEAEDEEEEPEEDKAPPEPPYWAKPLLERVPALLDRLMGAPKPTAAITGAATAKPEDAEFIRACLRAKNTPGNEAYINSLLASYGDKAAGAADENAG